MHAYEEILGSGQPGAETMSLTLRLLRQAIRLEGTPPPSSDSAWTKDGYDETLQAIFASRPKMLLSLVEAATSDRSFERMLLKSLRNALIDLGRATPAGRMVRRLRNVLGSVARFLHLKPPEHLYGWALVGAPTQRTSRSREDMARAARKVPGTIDHLNRAGPTPRHVQQVICDVAEAVILDADGSVSESDMAVTVLTRFELWDEPRAATEEPAPWAGEEAALEVWASLDEDQRMVLTKVREGADVPSDVSDLYGPREVESIMREIVSRTTAIVTDPVAAQQVLEMLRANPPEDPKVTSSYYWTGIQSDGGIDDE